ncbi:MAG TPA: OsmC family protein [Casimicrobiaceae bacterium]|nr:OsmC family protein [Casimicrobiaceae bacterium]
MIIRIEAHVDNAPGRHEVVLATNGTSRALAVPPKVEGGSSANGGELLCLALATCYCNDAYREAAKRGIDVTRVAVEVHAEFGAAGEPARAIRYRADIEARAGVDAIRALMLHTDAVAEVQRTLRLGLDVRFEPGEARPRP